MDGTLLNSQDIITEENVKALKKLQQSGTEVMIASGRLDLMVKRYIHQLDLRGHVIACNGGLIRNIKTNEIVYSNAMDHNIVEDILTFCIEENINFLLYTADVVFSNRNNPRLLRYEEMNRSIDNSLRFEVNYLDDTVMEVIKDIDVLKVLLICDNQEQVGYLIDKFSQIDKLTVVSSAKDLVDIMASNTSKGKAITVLAEKLKVKLEDVIAFGDNYNDMDLLQSVGMPIAMENAVEELKTEAKYITKSNEESGVAYAINNYILR